MGHLKLLEFYQKGLEGMLEGKGLPYICSLLSKEMNCPVILVDNTSKILVYQDVTGKGPKLSSFFDINDLGPDVYRYPISGNGHKGGKFVGELILLSKKGFSEEELSLLDAITRIIGLQIMNERELLSTERKYRDEFVYDILHNNIPTRQTMIRRSRFWGWDLTGHHTVAVLKPYLKNKENLETKIEMLYNLATYLIPRTEEKEVAVGENEIIILQKQKGDYSEHKIKITNKIRELSNFASEKAGINFTTGIGQPEESMELYRSYYEAKQAILVKECLGEHGSIAFYEDLGIMRLLISVGEYKLKTFTDELLAPLFSLDKAAAEELITTLNVYFDNDEDQRETAKELFIHINTLKYRLNRIQEILGINLRKLEGKLNLFFALKCYQMQYHEKEAVTKRTI